MNRFKLASIALLVVASTGLVFGSMGFSSVAADRGISVSVADDDSALVGYDTDGQAVTGDERLGLVTVTNRLPSEATVTEVTVDTDPDIRVGDVTKPTLEPGEEELIDADVYCEPDTDVDVTVSVTVEGEGVTAAISGDTTTRSFTVSCAEVGTQEDSGNSTEQTTSRSA